MNLNPHVRWKAASLLGIIVQEDGRIVAVEVDVLESLEVMREGRPGEGAAHHLQIEAAAGTASP